MDTASKAAVWGACVALVFGCGAAGRTSQPALTLRPACQEPGFWNGTRCHGSTEGRAAIEAGATALREFRLEDATTLLEQAKTLGPYPHGDLVRLNEQLGIAYAYVDREADAQRSFERLLELEPAHVLSYTLSPKVTFVFERVRKQQSERPTTAIDLSWPRTLEVSQAIPVEIAVESDPQKRLVQASLHIRKRGDRDFRLADVTLPDAGSYRTVRLPAAGGQRPETIELFLSARDHHGNEIYLLGGPERPREVALGYTPPTPWYKRTSLWVAAGVGAAVITGGIVYALTREPPALIGGSFQSR